MAAKKRKVAKKRATKKKRAPARKTAKKKVTKRPAKKAAKKRTAKKKTARKPVKRNPAPKRQAGYIVVAGGRRLQYFDGERMRGDRSQAVVFGVSTVARKMARRVAQVNKAIKKIGIFSADQTAGQIRAAFESEGKKKR